MNESRSSSPEERILSGTEPGPDTGHESRNGEDVQPPQDTAPEFRKAFGILFNNPWFQEPHENDTLHTLHYYVHNFI